MTKNPRKQIGVSLIETVLSIAIIATAVAYMTNRHFTDKEILVDRAMGQYMNSASEGLQKYITANQAAILAGTIPATDGTCSSSVCTINTSPSSGLSLYLPDGFFARSPWYRSNAEGTMTAKIRIAGALPYQVIQGFVFATPVVPRYADTDSQETHLAAVISSGGLNTGAVYPNPPSGAPAGAILGNNGAWSSNLNALYGSTLPVSTVVARTGDGLPQADEFLKLDGTNAMTGSLNMGGTKQSASDMNNIKNIASTGIANAPNVQFGQVKVTGDINVGAGDDYLSGVNFVAPGGIELGSIRADQAAGGTKVIGSDFVIGGQHVSAQKSLTNVANIWYVPGQFNDTSYQLNTPTWQQWGTLNVDMTNALAGDNFSLGTLHTSNLLLGGSTGALTDAGSSSTRVRIIGSGSNTMGNSATGLGVMHVNNNLNVYSGITNVTGNTLIEQTMKSNGTISVDQINSSTWGSNPVDVTTISPASGTWQFNSALYAKNIKMEPNNSYTEDGGCTTGSVGANSIGAILYCKGGVWKAGWH